MADGSWYRATKRTQDKSGLGKSELGEVLAGRTALWARCVCGEQAVLDAAPWRGQGLDNHPLAQLEDRVRCRCGARHVRLEVGAPQDAPTSAGRFFIFR